MRDHDFALGQGDNVWRLVQIDSSLVAQFSLQPDMSVLNDAICVQLDSDARYRLLMLIDWLEAIEANAGSIGLSSRVVGLILAAIAGEAGIQPTQNDADGGLFHRVLPALEQLGRHPSDPPGLGTAAAICNMSPDYFGRNFKHLFGSSFAAYSLSFRLRLAAQSLLTTRQSVSEIAYAFGFPNISHFSFRFREQFGMTPRQYRNEALVDVPTS
jgi:AraC-like DNA-binding protein